MVTALLHNIMNIYVIVSPKIRYIMESLTAPFEAGSSLLEHW